MNREEYAREYHKQITGRTVRMDAEWLEGHTGMRWISNGSQFGTHLPIVLQCAVRSSPLSILELGGGEYSTPFLHAFAHGGRKVVTMEHHRALHLALAKKYANRSHQVVLLDPGYEELPAALLQVIDALGMHPRWGVVLVDHVEAARDRDVRALLPYTEYLIWHDQHDDPRPEYRHRWLDDLIEAGKVKYKPFSRWSTVVLSMYRDLNELEDLD